MRRISSIFHSKSWMMAFFLFLFGLLLYFITTSDSELLAIETAKKCYFHNGRNPNGTGKGIKYFKDLLTAAKQPEEDKGIFFIWTRCSDNGIADIKPRFACSIEAAAKGNPTREIFIVFASPVGLPRLEQDWSSTVKILMAYPNVYFRNVQLLQLCADTPLEDWIESSDLFISTSRYEHTSDIMRVLLLYKYGGTYMDMDYLMLRNLNAIDRNWIVIEQDIHASCINNAVFDFRRSGIGRVVSEGVLSDLSERYVYYSWNYNGPYSFQRALSKICNESQVEKMDRQKCRGVEIYPPKMFYPLEFIDRYKLFRPNETEGVLNKMKNVMGLHLWNSGSQRVTVNRGNGSAYDIIAQEHCPRIYAGHDDF